MASDSTSLPIFSKSTIFPSTKSSLPNLKLSVSDLPMLSCHYIQKGLLFPTPPFPISHLLTSLARALSCALAHFPPLACRLVTESEGQIYITCNDAGADFIHANAHHIYIKDLLVSENSELPFFAFNYMVSYEGHFRPILAVQVTELADGVFIGCSVNHAVTDGTSFWNFFNAFAELTRGGTRISSVPDFSRDSALISPAVLEIPAGGPVVSFSTNGELRERIFRFSREAIVKLKARVNLEEDIGIDAVEMMGKNSNDNLKFRNGIRADISSFQSLCALLWRGITRARKFQAAKRTTFRMAVNCRHRLEPAMDPLYFGNAIQSIAAVAAAGDVVGKGLRWCAAELNRHVAGHMDATVRKYVEDWEREPRCFPLGNFDGAMITMGSSPRFPMFENDFGWGKPVAVRSGRANKFDGKISAFPGRVEKGSVDLEVVLVPESMAGLERDPEFMQYVCN